MNAIGEFLSGSTCQHLAMALLHTLWQGLAVVVLLWLLLRRIPADRPEARYWTTFGGLTGLVICGLLTWSLLDFDWPGDMASNGPTATRLATEPIAVDMPTQAVNRPAPEARAALAAELPRATAPRPVWPAYIMAGWLLGVVVMMGRMVWIVARLRRFVRGPEVTDDRIRLLIDELRQALHLPRLLKVVETVEEFGPAVLGMIRPVLTLPVSMMTGLPPEAVRAIVAHELAHIRRHDYLLNLVQMVIEAVLFFNPAVWWINRQIRIEREACCDAMAATILGQPLALAEALSLWAERMALRPSPATAFAGAERPGPRLLLDRVLRIVRPGYRPQSPLSPLGVLGLFLGGMVALGILSCGTSAIVELAAKALTPAERMERIVETQQQYAPPESRGKGDVTLSGTLRTSDGKPLSKNVSFAVNAYTGYSNGCGVYGDARAHGGSFTMKVPPGRTWLFAGGCDEYAPALVGPINGRASETVSGIDVVFEKGSPLTIRVLNEKGQPVGDAGISASSIVEEHLLGSCSYTTNDKGIAVMPISNAIRLYDLSVRKAGFQPLDQRKISVKPDQTLTLTLSHAQPVRGVVLSPNGRSIAGVEIRQYIKDKRGGDTSLSGQYGQVLAKTDAEGHFVLNALEDDAAYLLVAESKEYGRKAFSLDSPLQKELSIKFGPVLTVSGIVRGNLDMLTEEKGQPSVSFTLLPSLAVEKFHGWCNIRGTAPVRAINGKQRFVIGELLPGEITIRAGEHVVRTKVSESEPNRQVTIDLTQSAGQTTKRQVVLRFTTPDGSPPPRGRVYVNAFTDNTDGHDALDKSIPIEDGVAKFDAYVSGQLVYSPKGMLGYWFEGVRPRVEAGDGPLEITVPVVPAGAIVGQVLNSDGTPIANASVSPNGVWRSTTRGYSGSFGSDPVNVDDKGRFFITPLPLDGTYTMFAMRGLTVQFSSPVTLDATQPTTNVTIRFPSTTTAEGHVLDPEGRPQGRWRFGLEFYSSPAQRLYRWEITGTDKEGRFHFPDLSVGIGQYVLDFNPQQDFRPLRMPLPLDGKPVTVQLQRGLVLEGQVLQFGTDRPVPGERVFLALSEHREGDSEFFHAEATSDGEGRFRFNTLDDRPYNIYTTDGRQSSPGCQVMPGKKPIVLRVTLPEGSPLKPQEKKEGTP